MTKLSFSVSPTEVSAQGAAFTVDPADFAAIALEGIFVYGLRRWFQDKINSEAHALREAAKEAKAKGEAFDATFDVQASFLARLEAAKTGILSAPRNASGPALSAFDEELYTVAVDVKAKLPALVKAWTDSKGLATAERKAAILAAVAALPAPQLAKLRAATQTRLDARLGLDFDV